MNSKFLDLLDATIESKALAMNVLQNPDTPDWNQAQAVDSHYNVPKPVALP